MGMTSFVFNGISNIGFVTSALIGLVAMLIFYRMVKYWKYKLPPGPPGYPLIGNVLEMRGKESHKLFVEWSKKYGPVISVYYGPELYVVLNNSDVVLEALVKKQNDFAGRPRSATLDVMSDDARSVPTGEGLAWKMHKTLQSTGVRKFLKQGAKLDDTLHTNMAFVGDLIAKEKGAINPSESVLYVVANNICAMCFGNRYDFEDEDFQMICDFSRSVVDSDESSLLLEDYIPLLKRFPTKTFRNMQRLYKRFFSIIQNHITEHRRSLDPNNIRDITDAVLIAQAEEEKEGNEEKRAVFTDRYLVQTLNDFFGGGMDTIRLTIAFALKCLAVYEDSQSKVHTEIDRVVGSGRMPRTSDKDDLVYVTAVLREVLRIHTVVQLGLPHKTTCDTTVGGYDVPKGVTVLPNLWAVHHDPMQWDDVEEFRPERFLDNDGKLGAKPRNWLPFGAGSRGCPGEYLGTLQLVLILACFMQRFRVRIPEGESRDLSDKAGFYILFPPPFELLFEER